MEKLVVDSDGPRGADPQCREPQSPGEVAGTVAQPVPQATVLTPALQAPRLSLGTAAQGWGLSVLEELGDGFHCRCRVHGAEGVRGMGLLPDV